MKYYDYENDQCKTWQRQVDPTWRLLNVIMYEAVPMARVAVKVLIWPACLCAWLFAVTTVIGVAGALVLCVVRPDATHRIMGVSVGGTVMNSWALTYTGWPGVLLALGEIIAVMAGLGTSIARKTPHRHIGHLILVLWAALWTVNAFRVFPDGEFNLIYWMPFCLLCTCIRAAASLGHVDSGAPR